MSLSRFLNTIGKLHYTKSSGNPQTRIMIMETTRRLIEESQGKPVRLQHIAKAAGVSRQTIYLYLGSRVGLMVATVQYVDESAGLIEQLRPARKKRDSGKAIERFIDVWAGYVPTIYALDNRLIVLRETNKGAAPAWNDRMDSLRNGARTFLLRRLEKQDWLDPSEDIEAVIDFFSTPISISPPNPKNVTALSEARWILPGCKSHLRHVKSVQVLRIEIDKNICSMVEYCYNSHSCTGGAASASEKVSMLHGLPSATCELRLGYLLPILILFPREKKQKKQNKQHQTLSTSSVWHFLLNCKPRQIFFVRIHTRGTDLPSPSPRLLREACRRQESFFKFEHQWRDC